MPHRTSRYSPNLFRHFINGICQVEMLKGLLTVGVVDSPVAFGPMTYHSVKEILLGFQRGHNPDSTQLVGTRDPRKIVDIDGRQG